MITDDVNRENMRSTLRILERKILKRTGSCFSSEDVENFIEAAMFLKERGYSLADIVDRSRDTMEEYEILPEEDRDILDGLDFPLNLEKLLKEEKADEVVSLVTASVLFQAGHATGAETPGALFEEVVRGYDTRRIHSGRIRQTDNLALLMQDLLLQGMVTGPEGEIRIYDMAMGTGTLLSGTAEKAGKKCPGAHIICCGQEADPHKYILAKAIAALKGLEHGYENANVIPEDRFIGQSFTLGITEYPVEKNWGSYSKEVIEEYKDIPFGRFQPGLPSISNVQILYLLNGISKMEAGGRMAIIMTSDALSDPRAKEMENIRRYVLESDLIETIVRTKVKPKTRKFSCIYVLDKNKPAERKGKIQVIDMSDEMVEGRDTVLQAYKEFRNQVYEDGEQTIESRICSAEEFGNTFS